MGVAAITDRRNRVPPFIQPAFIGALLAVLGMFMAYNAGKTTTFRKLNLWASEVSQLNEMLCRVRERVGKGR